MSRLKAVTAALGLGKGTPACITPGPKVDNVLLDGGVETLRTELEQMYWGGIKAEVENIIRTLQAWQEPDVADASIQVPDEDDFVHGFDTFLDNVSQGAREFAIRHGMLPYQSLTLRPGDKRRICPNSSEYEPALRRVATDRRAEYVSTKLKSSVRKGIDVLPKLDGPELRAWSLLQAAGFLDIDKLIEHRPPQDRTKSPGIPQLTLAGFDSLQNPRFQALRCSRRSCKRTISGSMFVSGPNGPGTICEDCYWQHCYVDDSYTKTYKHYVLPSSITPQKSRELCDCGSVPHHDASGTPLGLFPLDKGVKHRRIGGGKSAEKCNLLKLGELVSQAKYDGLLNSVGLKGSEVSRALTNVAAAETAAKTSKSENPSEGRSTKAKTAVGMGSVDLPTEAETDPDIPPFFRAFARNNAFGDVHMALRVGPLVIENGVANTKSGALITLREVPVFHERFALASQRDTALVVSSSSPRTLWKQKRKPPDRRRYKAVMKQVVGSPFTGLFPVDDELEIVRDLLAASKQLDGYNLEKQDALDSVLEPTMHKLKKFLQIHVRVYLTSVASRLFDIDTTLAWSVDNNSCQAFCNALIDATVFEPLVSKPPPGASSTAPLYLFSFVTRSPPESEYIRAKINSKYDVPPGHVEEYLMRFHFGHNMDSSDLIDTCHEYWTDWAALDGPMHPGASHSLFPWDCTEAFGHYPTVCGGDHQLKGQKNTAACNLARHIWAFPFDAWSFIAQHLARDKHLYPAQQQSEPSWKTNRLTLLRANSLLSRAAAAMARTPLFHAATAWLTHSHSSSDAAPSLIALHPALARVRLGGIHRAQPASHYFDATGREAGASYFLADWALWSRGDRVGAYEEARRERMKPGAAAGSSVQLGRVRWLMGVGQGTGGGGGGGGGGGLAWRAVLDLQVQATLWATLDTADCGFTAWDTVGGGAGGAGGPNCGSCTGSATACGGGGGGSSGGGESSGGGGGGCGGGGSSGGGDSSGGGGGGCGGGGSSGGGGCGGGGGD
ncbi:hypothetical protein N658DRAFT_430575 [Parathielavia hyrcaniae]|uniref:Uncharacterized protein n=1 Tax=Parathielavia hyrcaniae TaxID=113614 RepID=A0AAN6PZU1_9PEZI|nr:hypothetical protein N658DRAFT_430575 [Parathielavia hyrcaniae]